MVKPNNINKNQGKNQQVSTSHFLQQNEYANSVIMRIQFVIFNPWKVPWNWIALKLNLKNWIFQPPLQCYLKKGQLKIWKVSERVLKSIWKGIWKVSEKYLKGLYPHKSLRESIQVHLSRLKGLWIDLLLNFSMAMA